MDRHLPVKIEDTYLIANAFGWMGNNVKAKTSQLQQANENQRHEFFMSLLEYHKDPQTAKEISLQWGTLEKEIAQWETHRLKVEDKNEVQARHAWFQVQWLLAQMEEMFELKANVSTPDILKASHEQLLKVAAACDKEAMELLETMEKIILDSGGTHAWRNAKYCVTYGRLREIAMYAWQARRRLDLI